ncbi:MAG: M42 family metallopeptidase [Clostridia bacterium]|nr:M42 family metallopeptidase [Clostridia bacterium]MDD4681238.1 M42 family metallopeptidase [Clostridia bacterium]
MVEVLEGLTNARGVSGNENEVREIILELAAQTGAELSVDRMGNVIARKTGKGSGTKVMAAAHMDEVGLIISAISDNGMLKFQPIGAIDQRLLLSKRVLIGKDAIPGVIGVKAIHLQERDERNKVIKQKQMFIDIGASSKEDAQKVVQLGDYASFDSSFTPFGDNKVKAKALDDRVGCSVLLELLKESYDFEFIACFTVQEEVGLRGATAAAYHLNPDIAIVLEGTTCADIPDVPEHMVTTRMGRGPAVSFMDKSSIANPKLFKQMVETAETHGIPYQVKENIAGGNDAGTIQTTHSGVAAVVVSTPCRYIHSPSSMLDLEDYYNTIRLVKEFLKGCGSR